MTAKCIKKSSRDHMEKEENGCMRIQKPPTVNLREKEHQNSEINDHFITDVTSKLFNGKIVILSKKRRRLCVS